MITTRFFIARRSYSVKTLRMAKAYQRRQRRHEEGDLIDIANPPQTTSQTTSPSKFPPKTDAQLTMSYRQRLKKVIPRKEILEKMHLYRLGADQSPPSMKNAPVLPALKLQYQISDKKTLLPPRKLPEFAFIGRSNVGKSYLINALASPTHEANTLQELKRSFRATAGISSTPGYTQSLDFYRCGNVCTFVDMPGYGFAQTTTARQRSWSDNIQRYLVARKSDTLKKLFVLLDARWGPLTADREFFRFIAQKSIPVQFILTKCDQVPAEELVRRHQLVEEELSAIFPPKQWESRDLMMVSSKTYAGIEAVRRLILRTSDHAELIPKESLSRETMENSWLKTTAAPNQSGMNSTEPGDSLPSSPFRLRPHQRTQKRGIGADKRLAKRRRRIAQKQSVSKSRPASQ